MESFQNEFKKGKEKLQSSKEVSALKSKISQKEKHRARLMIEVGEVAYNKIRKGEIDFDGFEEFLDTIKKIDRSLFNDFKILDEKTRRNEGLVCECGEGLTEDSKFCGVCGKEVIEDLEDEDLDYITCTSCGEEILGSSNFCSSCGFNIS